MFERIVQRFVAAGCLIWGLLLSFVLLSAREIISFRKLLSLIGLRLEMDKIPGFVKTFPISDGRGTLSCVNFGHLDNKQLDCSPFCSLFPNFKSFENAL